MSGKNDWIFYVVAIAVLLGGAWACSASAPCDWYDNVPNKNVPMRCVK